MNRALDRRLRPDLTIVEMAEGVQLRIGDNRITVIETPNVSDVARLLEATRSGFDRDQLLSISSGDEDLVGALEDVLQRHSLLTEDWDDSDEIERYLRSFSQTETPKPAFTSLIAGPERISQLLIQCLADHQMEAVRIEHPDFALAASQKSVLVCLWEQGDLPVVQAWNRMAVLAQVPCLFVDLSHGRYATIGPFYVPGAGSCYECFRQRLRQNTSTLTELDAFHRAMEHGTRGEATGLLPANRYQIVGMACGELFAFGSRHRELQTVNRAITVSLERNEVWSEPVWRIPWCSACEAEG